jgi:hypothetical protein
MITSLSDSSKVKMYLQKECNHVFKPLKSDTDISIKSNLPIIEFQVNLAELNNMKQVSKYSDIGGIYLFSHKDKMIYILVQLLIYMQDLKVIRQIVLDLTEEKIVNFTNI